MNGGIEARIERKIGKAREALLAEADPEEKRRLLKKIKKLRARTETPALAPTRNLPREATRVRHRWDK